MNDKDLMKIVDEAFAIEMDNAKEAGALGFMARAMTIATMPHSKVEGCSFERTNGNFSLVMLSPPKIGLPYGSVPRLLMGWVSTEAVKRKSRRLVLGASLSQFMFGLDLVPTGGRWGSITRLKNQMERLFSCSISCIYMDESRTSIRNRVLIDDSELWWDPKKPEQAALWQSSITLSEKFYEEIINHPVPIDLRALKVLKRSPLALDIYCWLTYRVSYLKKTTTIPWEALQMQFGAGYPFTNRGLLDFKRKFLKHLKTVLAIYPNAKVDVSPSGLQITPSETHVPRVR